MCLEEEVQYCLRTGDYCNCHETVETCKYCVTSSELYREHIADDIDA